jgi:hypothetical protein
LARFTLDSASEFLLGNCVESLSAVLPYPYHVSTFPEPQTTRGAAANDFARAFLEAQEMSAARERLGWIWPLFEILHDNTAEPMKVVNRYLEPLIKDALERKASHPSKTIQDEKNREIADDESLLDHLVNQTSGTSF